MKMKNVSGWILSVALLLSGAGAASGQGLPALPLNITADRLESVDGNMIATGAVEIEYEGDVLKADRVSVNPETGDMHAQGSVYFSRASENTEWRGEEITYNYKTKEGDFGPFTAHMQAFRITAEDAERISENEFLLKNARLTTCDNEPPTVSIFAKEARLIDRNYIKAKGVTFYAGRVPLFYLPYYARHLGDRTFTVIAGDTGEWGPYVRTITKLHLSTNLVSKTHADYYNRRGIGVGQDLEWNSGKTHAKLKTYYISDAEPNDDDNLVPQRIDPDFNDHERYRVLYEHDQTFASDRQYLKAKLNWLSDPDVIDDFFNQEFIAEAQPENYIGLATSGENHTAGLYVNKTLNDFYQNVDRLPQVQFDQYSTQVKDTPLFYRTENKAGFLEKQYPEYDDSLPGEYRSWRLDSLHLLEMPTKMFGFLNLIPYASYRATYYSDTPDAHQDNDLRHVFEGGLRASFKAYRTLTEKEGFWGEGLRHVFEPFAHYYYRPKPNLQPANRFTNAEAEIYEFDDIDELDEANDIRFGMRNKIQTRRNGRVTDFIDSEVYTVFRAEREKGEAEFDHLYFDTDLFLTEKIRLAADLEYDWYTRLISPLNARAYWRLRDDTELRASYRYRQHENDLVTVGMELFPNRNWSFDIYSRYDKVENEWERNSIMVKHRFNCLGMGFGYAKTESDHQLLFYLWLLELGEVSQLSFF